MVDVLEKAEATFGGKNLLLSTPVRWTLTEGVQPSVSTLEIAPEDAINLAAGRGPYTLEIKPVDGQPLRVEQLWVLNVEPGPHPYISRLHVADRRWFWPYVHVLFRANVRRKAAFKRVVANDQFAVPFDRAPQVAFWRWSLDDDRPFVPLRLLDEVFKEVAKAEKSHHGSAFRLKIDHRIGEKIRGLPLEDVQIDDPGDVAIRRVLANFPEAGVTVGYDGTVVVFSRAGGDESLIVSALMPEIRDQGHTDLVKNSNIRPKEIHVLFTREVEVRFDYVEAAQARGTTVAVGEEPLADRREMENVLAIPDYQLAITEIDPNRPVVQGTWVTFDQAFRAWGNMPMGRASRELDHDLVQRAFIPHMDLWALLEISGQRPDEIGRLQPWPGRIAAVQNHYRQTFRLNRRWMDRILSFRAHRVSVVDPQSGQRGPARAWGDYSIIYTQRSLWRNRAQGAPLDYAINRSAFPTGGPLDADAEPSPAIVSVMDHDQGIIHLDYRGTDPLSGDTRMILPSQIQGMPAWDVTRNRKRFISLSFDSVVGRNDPPRLSASYRLAVIVSAIPASPNAKRQLHRIVVRPDDVKKLLPPSQTTGLDDARGPIMEIRIGPNVEMARIQWLDSRSADIEKIFGITEGEPNLDNLVVNEGPDTDLRRGASLTQLARAQAALIWASLVDRYEEDMTGYLNPNVHLSGWVGEISHEYGLHAETLTRVTFPPRIPQMSLLSFLDSNTRQALLKLVQPQ